ncbi:MarC family protein, partial [Roseiarcus sp.]|uniref:MarC family protein n=1 Tax=Roseiarcus sp. TaxID=1969460 RepID=UPI003D117F04
FFLGASVAGVANAAIIWIAYRFADRLTELMGATARTVIVRLTAFLLMCIGVQILVTAIGDLVVRWRGV